jgi:hypothetical protein
MALEYLLNGPGPVCLIGFEQQMRSYTDIKAHKLANSAEFTAVADVLKAEIVGTYRLDEKQFKYNWYAYQLNLEK